MRTIVCFGDSNTHGSLPMEHPEDRRRWGRDKRWPGVLSRELGADWLVVEEGLPGRTTVHSDPVEGAHKNGLVHLPSVLESHRPIDVMVVMLGTNDLKMRFSLPAEDIARSVGVLVQTIQASPAGIDGRPPAVLVVAPVPITEVSFMAPVLAGGAEKSRKLAGLYAAVAKRFGAAFLDAGAVAKTSPVDGIHLDAEAHRLIGEAIARAVSAM